MWHVLTATPVTPGPCKARANCPSAIARSISPEPVAYAAANGYHDSVVGATTCVRRPNGSAEPMPDQKRSHAVAHSERRRLSLP